MSRSDDEKLKSGGDKLLENFLRGPFLPENEIAENEAASAQLEGTSREVAFIDEDGTICINYFGQKDYVSGRGWEQFSPDEPQYAEYCKKYGLKKPGDSKCIFRRFIDGEWIVVDEKQEQKKAESDSQS